MINRAAQSYIPYLRRGCIFFYKKIRFRLLCHALFSVKTNSFHLIIPHFRPLYILFLLLFMVYGLFYTSSIAFTFSFKGFGTKNIFWKILFRYCCFKIIISRNAINRDKLHTAVGFAIVKQNTVTVLVAVSATGLNKAVNLICLLWCDL